MTDPPVCPLEPLGGRIVLRRLDGVRVTPGGILLPDSPKARKARVVHEGVVAAVSAEETAVRVGDRVVFTSKRGVTDWYEDGVVWTLAEGSDVLCALRDD